MGQEEFGLVSMLSKYSSVTEILQMEAVAELRVWVWGEIF